MRNYYHQLFLTNLRYFKNIVLYLALCGMIIFFNLVCTIWVILINPNECSRQILSKTTKNTKIPFSRFTTHIRNLLKANNKNKWTLVVSQVLRFLREKWSWLRPLLSGPVSGYVQGCLLCLFLFKNMWTRWMSFVINGRHSLVKHLLVTDSFVRNVFTENSKNIYLDNIVGVYGSGR